MEIHQQPARESKRKRFKPWENLRRMFQRKSTSRLAIGSSSSSKTDTARSTVSGQATSSSSSARLLSGVFGSAGPSRSRSTSELLASEPQPIPVVSANASSRAVISVGGPLGAGLSLSHDSVFGLDASPSDSPPSFGPVASSQRQQPASMIETTSLQYMSELRAAIGGRRRSDEEDEGLPRSPVNAPPTTAQVLSTSSIHSSNPAHGGGGSDPSLLSINSCELEEASPMGLRTNKIAATQRTNENSNSDGRMEDSSVEDGSVGASSFPLNHSAARHKISIRPKKKHAPARHPSQLPQLVESLEDSPSAGFMLVEPQAPERRNRNRGITADGQNNVKPRSLSCSRTEDAGIAESHVDSSSDASNVKPSAGSSSTKLARSKSSVEKKIQHEVAVFWRRTKEATTGGLFNSKKDHSANKEAQQDEITVAAAVAPEVETSKTRKDLRKIKRDKEEKRKRNDAKTRDESPSPPAFLSRFFGSRRSARRNDKKTKTGAVPPPAEAPLSLKQEEEWVEEEVTPVPKQRTVFNTSSTEVAGDEEMEVDWRIPHSPFNFAPLPTRSVPVPRSQQQQQQDKWVDSDSYTRTSSPKLSSLGRHRSVEASSPLPTRHHRIHIAGLSPYQRRVARIGNGLEISDDEWDDDTAATSSAALSPTNNISNNNNSVSPTRSYHFRPEAVHHHRSDHSLDAMMMENNASLPVNINQDFILKKAPGATAGLTTDNNNIRRSMEILKFSNSEGLKKTIDSLNQSPKRSSQSSDQLHLSSDDNQSGNGVISSSRHQQHESSGSLSNSTSSLNISDVGVEEMEEEEEVSSLTSLAHSVEEKDVRDDVEEVHDQFRWNMVEPVQRASDELATEDQPDESSTTKSAASSSSSPSSPRNSAGSDADDSSNSKNNNTSSWDEKKKKQTTPPPSQSNNESILPMFSMSVRVQNPPTDVNNGRPMDGKFRRSVSIPNETTQPTLAVHRNSLPKPFVVTSVRMEAPSEGQERLPPQQLMAKLISARPWQSKEEKDRQNKVALHLDHHPEEEVFEIPPDVKLRPKNNNNKTSGGNSASGETSELLKVFARRSLKIDTQPEEQLPTTTNRQRPTSIGGPRLPVEPQTETVPAAVEKTDAPKKKKSPKPPPVMIVRSPLPATDASAPTVSIHTQEACDPVGEMEKSPPAASLLFIRLPAVPVEVKNDHPVKAPNPTEKSSPADTNRIISAADVTGDPASTNNADDIWKRLPKTRSKQLSVDHKFIPSANQKKNIIKTNDEAVGATPTVRQSKVLDMVHNFQRLQVT